MTAKKQADTKKRKQISSKSIDKKKYEEFVKKVELVSIVLANSHAEKNPEFTPSPGLTLSYELSESIEEKRFTDPFLTAYPEYQIHAFLEDTETGKKEEFFKISVKFEIIYRLPEFNDKLWEIFSSINVPLNIWPYLREYVHNTTMRFGLPPLLLTVRQF
ncbi:protein-export chaperone SecB [bacterium]|nr:protein-export chaperone SecB [bacterium]